MKKIISVLLIVSLALLSCSKKSEIPKESNISTDSTKEPTKSEEPAKEETNITGDIITKPDKSNVNILDLTESSRPTLSEKIYTFEDTNSLIKTNIDDIRLIGLDTDNYYFTIADDKNNNYYIANKIEKSLKFLYKCPIQNDIFLETISNGTLFVVTGTWEDRLCHYQIISVNRKGEETIIHKGKSIGYPTVSIVGNHAIIEYVGVSNDDRIVEEEDIIASINLDDKSYKDIYKSTFTRDYPYYTGTFTMSIGGWEDGFCYENVQMNNESIEDDDAGLCSIYYYSFKDGKHEKLIDYPNKLLYIRGDKECFLTSDYLLRSKENSGKITIREDNTYKTYNVPGVIPGSDINGSYRLSDNVILAYNSDYFWIFDIKNKTYYKEKYEYLNEDPENLYLLNLKAHDRQFAYLEPSEDKIIVHTFTLNND